MSKVNGIEKVLQGLSPEITQVIEQRIKDAQDEGAEVAVGCSKVKNAGLAMSASGNQARATALNNVCSGGKPGVVRGRVSGGILGYNPATRCAVGAFRVACDPSNPAEGKKVAAQGDGVKAERPQSKTPQVLQPSLTVEEKAAMADLGALMDEMRGR